MDNTNWIIIQDSYTKLWSIVDADDHSRRFLYGLDSKAIAETYLDNYYRRLWSK